MGAVGSRAFEEMREAADTILNPEVRTWKDSGGKVAAYFCSAFPEEVIAAAGLLPFRLRATGSAGTELSDAFFSTINCSFPRHVFNMALSGRYDFLDALVMCNSCDNIRRVYDHWVRQMKTPFVHIMSLPRKAEPAQVEWFYSELVTLRHLLEEQFDVEITDERLWETIALHNESRRLQRKLYDLRKGDRPPVTGAETLTLTVAGTCMPKWRYNELLADFLDRIGDAEGINEYRARLMIVGGILDDPQYVKVIEDQGGLVVTDSLCFGSRLFWSDVNDAHSDPLMALAHYYVADRPSCPRVFGLYEKRSQYIRDMIQEFKVDGVILERLAFCDLWGFEQYTLFNDFKEWNIPLLMLDREYTLGGIGQLRTRVQAFLETMGR